MAEWFYAKDNAQHGPVSDFEIRSLISSGQITQDTVIWREGMADWLPLSEVKDFQPTQASGLQNTAAGPPPASPASPYSSPQTKVSAQPHGMTIPTDGMATASLVCGILSVTTCGFFTGIPAVICGHKSLTRINSSPTPIQGKGMAIAGLVTGYLSLLFSMIAIIVITLGAMAGDTNQY